MYILKEKWKYMQLKNEILTVKLGIWKFILKKYDLLLRKYPILQPSSESFSIVLGKSVIWICK